LAEEEKDWDELKTSFAFPKNSFAFPLPSVFQEAEENFHLDLTFA